MWRFLNVKSNDNSILPNILHESGYFVTDFDCGKLALNNLSCERLYPLTS